MVSVLQTISVEVFEDQSLPNEFIETPPRKDQNTYQSYINEKVSELNKKKVTLVNQQKEIESENVKLQEEIVLFRQQIQTLELENASLTCLLAVLVEILQYFTIYYVFNESFVKAVC